jgi:hypothetical protein
MSHKSEPVRVCRGCSVMRKIPRDANLHENALWAKRTDWLDAGSPAQALVLHMAPPRSPPNKMGFERTSHGQSISR